MAPAPVGADAWNCSTFDIQWREAMMELLDQLEAENPEDVTLAPQVRRSAASAPPSPSLSLCARPPRSTVNLRG